MVTSTRAHCSGNKALRESAYNVPDRQINVVNMGPIWGQQDPGGPHVGPTNLAIWVMISTECLTIHILFLNMITSCDDILWWHTLHDGI